MSLTLLVYFNVCPINNPVIFYDRWSMTPPTVNAYYSSIDNKIGEDAFVFFSAIMLVLYHILLIKRWVYTLHGYSISFMKDLIKSSKVIFLKQEKKIQNKKATAKTKIKTKNCFSLKTVIICTVSFKFNNTSFNLSTLHAERTSRGKLIHSSTIL